MYLRVFVKKRLLCRLVTVGLTSVWQEYFSPAEPDNTCRIHPQKCSDYDITLQVPVTPSLCLVCDRNASPSSGDIIRFKKPQFRGVVFRFNQEPSSKKDSILHRCICCSLAGLKTQKSRTKCSFVKTVVLKLTTLQIQDRNGQMINLDDGRFLFQQRYYLYERNVQVTVEPLYNEVLGLTNYFFNSSNQEGPQHGSQIPPSRLFFLLIPLSRLFLRPNPDPALFFSRVSCFHYTMFKTSLLATRSFDV